MRTKAKKVVRRKDRTAPVIQIGASVDGINAARAAINDILGSPASDTAKIEALVSLRSFGKVGNTELSNCHIQG